MEFLFKITFKYYRATVQVNKSLNGLKKNKSQLNPISKIENQKDFWIKSSESKCTVTGFLPFRVESATF
tara:strand:+ start:278 stop:484 length:207 start_codon:yes stop_codon:yes gene_type:complete